MQHRRAHAACPRPVDAGDRSDAADAAAHSGRAGYAEGSRQEGCSQSASSCDDIGTITIAAPATDDVTDPSRIGYRFTYGSDVSELPAVRLQPPAYPSSQGLVSDGSDLARRCRRRSGDARYFTLQVVAIDLAGNDSAPQTVGSSTTQRARLRPGGRPHPAPWPRLDGVLALRWPAAGALGGRGQARGRIKQPRGPRLSGGTASRLKTLAASSVTRVHTREGDSDGRRHYADRSCATADVRFCRRRRPGRGSRRRGR